MYPSDVIICGKQNENYVCKDSFISGVQKYNITSNSYDPGPLEDTNDIFGKGTADNSSDFDNIQGFSYTIDETKQ